MEELMDILKDIKPDVDFENEANLIEDGLLDSFDIVALISAIDDEFDVKITVKDVIPENFASAETIYALIQKLDD